MKNLNFLTTTHTPEIINYSYSTRNERGWLLLINTTPGVTTLTLCSKTKMLSVSQGFRDCFTLQLLLFAGRRVGVVCRSPLDQLCPTNPGWPVFHQPLHWQSSCQKPWVYTLQEMHWLCNWWVGMFYLQHCKERKLTCKTHSSWITRNNIPCRGKKTNYIQTPKDNWTSPVTTVQENSWQTAALK